MAVDELRFNGQVCYKKRALQIRVWWDVSHCALVDEDLEHYRDKWRECLHAQNTRDRIDPHKTMRSLAMAVSTYLGGATVEVMDKDLGWVHYPRWP